MPPSLRRSTRGSGVLWSHSVALRKLAVVAMAVKVERRTSWARRTVRRLRIHAAVDMGRDADELGGGYRSADFWR